jgi:hypothetical protein
MSRSLIAVIALSTVSTFSSDIAHAVSAFGMACRLDRRVARCSKTPYYSDSPAASRAYRGRPIRHRGDGCPALCRSASIPLRQRMRENLFSDFVPDSFTFSNTHFPATPLKSPEPPVTLSLESWGRTLPRYLMSPEPPPISPLR